jgi:hypothetical protein
MIFHAIWLSVTTAAGIVWGPLKWFLVLLVALIFGLKFWLAVRQTGTTR